MDWRWTRSQTEPSQSNVWPIVTGALSWKFWIGLEAPSSSLLCLVQFVCLNVMINSPGRASQRLTYTVSVQYSSNCTQIRHFSTADGNCLWRNDHREQFFVCRHYILSVLHIVVRVHQQQWVMHVLEWLCSGTAGWIIKMKQNSTSESFCWFRWGWCSILIIQMYLKCNLFLYIDKAPDICSVMLEGKLRRINRKYSRFIITCLFS